jgi:copper(I)-binding protein
VIRSRRLLGVRPGVRATLLLTAGLALAASACGAGQIAETADQITTVDGATADVGTIGLRDIAIAYPEGGAYAEGDDARLELVIVNSGIESDALVQVRTDAAAEVSLGTGGSESPADTATPTESPTETGSPSPTETASPTGTAGPTEATGPAAPTRIELPPGQLVECREDGPAITFVGLTRAFLPAEIVPITFVFERAGDVTVQVPVAVSLSPLPPAPPLDLGPEEGTE